jgi:hypothetical protein
MIAPARPPHRTIAFDSFRLEQTIHGNIQSRIQDNDILTFGVLVNGGNQRHGTAPIPVRPSGATREAITAGELNQAAEVCGFPRTRSHMSYNWETGPLEVLNVSVVDTATNTDDSQIATADQQNNGQVELQACRHLRQLVNTSRDRVAFTGVTSNAGQHRGAPPPRASIRTVGSLVTLLSSSERSSMRAKTGGLQQLPPISLVAKLVPEDMGNPPEILASRTEAPARRSAFIRAMARSWAFNGQLLHLAPVICSIGPSRPPCE